MRRCVEWTRAISGLIDGGERRLFDRIAPKRRRDFRGWEEKTLFGSFRSSVLEWGFVYVS